MWAFVIYDVQTQTVFAARDRFGVKPLYYWESPEGFLAFASEIKEFTVLPGWHARLNGARAYDFLTSEVARTDHTSETMFKDVYQLRGGEALEVKIRDIKNGLPIYRWYNLKIIDQDINLIDAEYNFRCLFEDSIRLRLRSDVPVGSCLSGGLDSSSIVCVANNILKEQGKEEKQRTFSACAEDERIDERKYINEVVKSRNIHALYTQPSCEHLLKNLDFLIWHQDEPFDNTSMYAQWCVFKLAAASGVKVMLDGQGSDEQLCGYHRFFGCYYADIFKHKRFELLLQQMKDTKKIHGDSYTKSLAMMMFYLTTPPLRQKFKNLLGGSGIPVYDIKGDDNKVILPAGDVIQQNSYDQLMYSVLPQLLHYEDRNSMAHSIESRVPFLDYRLVEFNLGLRPGVKIANGYTKQILRHAMINILPENIRMRADKIGFATAEEQWMKDNPDIFIELLVFGIDSSKGILDDAALKKFDRMVTGKEKFSSFAWRVIAFGRWMKIFNVSI
jgi:asparagine synthase (glutamine-hydrolysing)